MTLKLESLLALYLYQHKVLNLPGIGSFTADDTVGIPENNDKHPATVQGISFTNKNVTEPDAAFIDFIKQHTGKMRSLAISDLESYLMLSRQFLNIGKPFYIEGIGSLQKSNDGSLQFTPGEYSSAHIPAADEKVAPEAASASRHGEAAGKHPHSQRNTGNLNNKAVLLLAAVVTLVVIGWGGYYLFKKNTLPEESLTDTTSNDALVSSPDSTLQQALASDTAKEPNDTPRVLVSQPPAGTYKFILEQTASRKRALKRFGDLMSYRSPVKMETADSVRFTIYALIRGTAADTARLKDSLNAWYYGTKEMKVSIAK